MLHQSKAACLQQHLDKKSSSSFSASNIIQQHESKPAKSLNKSPRITFIPCKNNRPKEHNQLKQTDQQHRQQQHYQQHRQQLQLQSPSPQQIQQHFKLGCQLYAISNNVALHSKKSSHPVKSLENGPNAQNKIAREQQKQQQQQQHQQKQQHQQQQFKQPLHQEHYCSGLLAYPKPKHEILSKLFKMKAQILYNSPSLSIPKQTRRKPMTVAAANNDDGNDFIQTLYYDHEDDLIDRNMLQQPKTPKKMRKNCNDPICESLDFNSRRRRGRLRSDANDLALVTVAAAAAAAAAGAGSTVGAAAPGLVVLKARHLNVPATFVYLNNVAKELTKLLLTLLLSFLSITFVNKQKLVLSLNQIFKNINRNNRKKATTATTTTKIAATTTAAETRKTFNTYKRKPIKTFALSALLKFLSSSVAATANTTSSSSSSVSTSAASSSTSSASSSYLTAVKFQNATPLKLLYAFLIISLLIILPSDHHMASAAKPKSATQLQQQQQQHHNNNHKPNIAYAAGADDIHIGKEGMILTPPSYQTSNEMDDTGFLTESEELSFDDERQNLNIVDEKDDLMEEDDDEEERGSYENATHFENVTEVIKTPLFPTDLFTREQLKNGAVICHIIGVIYMFVALAIVCDEFFVPSLDVIIEKLGITDDVAGATFMAAGGSAPELFTSVIGVFVSFDDVGIGTIVGSAVFNILFVIGMCALFSRTILSLTWWPLFRDCTFYSISLIVLIVFFRDNNIYWWEALILFSIYIAYVGFMKWNVQVESCVKRAISKNKVTRVRSTDQLMPAGNAANSSETSMATQPGGSVTSRAASETRSGPPGSSSGAGTTGNSSGGNANTTQTGAKFRHGLLQLMIHTIDPLHDDDVPGKVDEKATQLHAIASLKVLLDATKPQRGGATTSAANHVKINLKETTLADRPNGNIDTTLDSPSLSGRRASWIDQRVKIQARKFSIKQTQDIEDEPEPLSMAWPDTARKRLTYILVAPLLIPMWLTLPDTRTPKGKKLFPITFIGSIMWIAAFSYLMVWWANVAGDTAGIPPEVMGLTFLAAGTSIPDLITSVIVARKGFGDMAVSSSVGSNIFDVTVGLPIPWLLYGLINSAPVVVNSNGMVCSITILFMMLVFVVMSIACFHWRMNKGLGFTMFLLYFVFVAVSLMFEYEVITCPV